jgi:hypothetical protein
MDHCVICLEEINLKDLKNTSNKLKKSRHELIYLHIEYVRCYKISNDCPHLPNTESVTKVCNVINNYDMTNTTQSYI